MEKLEAEVQRLRKQVNFLGAILGVVAAVLIFRSVVPRNHHNYMIATDSLRTQRIQLIDEDGLTLGHLDGDGLSLLATPASVTTPIRVAMSVGVDEARQPSLFLNFHSSESTPRGTMAATLSVSRTHEGKPSASFTDADGRFMYWDGHQSVPR